MTGGQGADDEVLGSAEFFDLSTQQWTMVIIIDIKYFWHWISLTLNIFDIEYHWHWISLTLNIFGLPTTMPTPEVPTSRQIWGRHHNNNPSSKMPTLVILLYFQMWMPLACFSMWLGVFSTTSNQLGVEWQNISSELNDKIFLQHIVEY